MRHPVNPLQDFAFKRLFATEENLPLLCHFLNAVLKPARPFRRLALLDRSTTRKHLDDKEIVVDVLAIDESGERHHLEVQLQLHPALPGRILYAWAKVYEDQIARGQDYSDLRSVTSIWLLDGVLFPEDDRMHHHFRLIDPQGGVLSPHLNIHILELPKLLAQEDLDDEGRWVYFLRHAAEWTSLPEFLDSPIMRLAMLTLEEIERYSERWAAIRADFSDHLRATLEKEIRDLRAEADRQRAIVEEQRAAAETQRTELEAQRAAAETQRTELEAQRAAAETQRTELEAQRAELSRLRALLESAGMDTDAP